MPASNLTYLEVINRVLSRLREDTVAAPTTTVYSTFIGTLVNLVKAEIEDAWYWNTLRDTYTITAVPGTTSYALTSAGMNCVILSAFNTTSPLRMSRGTNYDFDEKFFNVTTIQTGTPELFIPAGVNSSSDMLIDIWPSPSSTNTLKINVYRPQADLSTATTVPMVPQTVLIEGVVARAMLERGDDGGTAAQLQEQLYRDLLASAVSRDSAQDDYELDWYRE